MCLVVKYGVLNLVVCSSTSKWEYFCKTHFWCLDCGSWHDSFFYFTHTWTHPGLKYGFATHVLFAVNLSMHNSLLSCAILFWLLVVLTSVVVLLINLRSSVFGHVLYFLEASWGRPKNQICVCASCIWCDLLLQELRVLLLQFAVHDFSFLQCTSIWLKNEQENSQLFPTNHT